MNSDTKARVVLGVALGLLAVGVDLVLNRLRRLEGEAELSHLLASAANQRCSQLESVIARRRQSDSAGDGETVGRN